jgi:VWFA-related protein
MRLKWIQSTLIFSLSLSLLTVCFAQSPPRLKKPIKDFGSSLKRLKSNPTPAAPVETTPTPKTQSEEVDEGDVIRTDTTLVSSELLVVDSRGNHVPGLKAEDFVITDNGEPQTVGHFEKGDNTNIPRTIVLVIDYSGSQVLYLKNSVAAAKVLVDKLGPRDLMAIVTDDIELLADFTNDKKKLKEKLDSLVKKTNIDEGFLARYDPWNPVKKAKIGASSQYSALMATLNEAFDHEDLRPIIIFQTDGDEVPYLRDTVIPYTIPPGLQGEQLEKARKMQKHIQQNVRDFSLEDVYRKVERSRATLYTVLPGPKLVGLTPKQQWEKSQMDEQMRLAHIIASAPEKSRGQIMYGLAATRDVWQRNNAEHNAKLQELLTAVAPLTGGWTEFLEQPEQADKIYARILSDINQRYIVGFYPTHAVRDGKRRKIDFQVKGHPEYQILGRRSYFARSP